MNKKYKEKEYICEIEFKFTQIVPAYNVEQAKEMLKETFVDEYGLTPTDKEIVSVKEIL